MKKFAATVILAGAVLPVSAWAQVMIDMNRITCAQYLAMPEEDFESVFGLDERLVQPKKGLHVGGYGSLRAECRECETVVPIQP